jgi:hypothetical protein
MSRKTLSIESQSNVGVGVGIGVLLATGIMDLADSMLNGMRFSIPERSCRRQRAERSETERDARGPFQ